MGHTWKNESHLKKFVKLGEMGHTCKKWVILEIMGDIIFRKRVTLGTTGQS